MLHTAPGRVAGCCLLIGLFGCAGRVGPGDGGDARTAEGPTEVVLEPPVLADTGWLQELRETQLRTVDDFDVFYDFQFTDRVWRRGPLSGPRWLLRARALRGNPLRTVAFFPTRSGTGPQGCSVAHRCGPVADSWYESWATGVGRKLDSAVF